MKAKIDNGGAVDPDAAERMAAQRLRRSRSYAIIYCLITGPVFALTLYPVYKAISMMSGKGTTDEFGRIIGFFLGGATLLVVGVFSAAIGVIFGVGVWWLRSVNRELRFTRRSFYRK